MPGQPPPMMKVPFCDCLRVKPLPTCWRRWSRMIGGRPSVTMTCPAAPGDRDFQSDHASKLGRPGSSGGDDLARAKGAASCLDHKAAIAFARDRASRGVGEKPGAVASRRLGVGRRHQQRVRKTLAFQETSADDVRPEIGRDRENFISRENRALDAHGSLGGYLLLDQPHFVWRFGNPKTAAEPDAAVSAQAPTPSSPSPWRPRASARSTA